MTEAITLTRPVIRKAERRKSKLRLALCGPTGSGKTMSALLLAFGLGEKVGLIDTEHGSGDLYADIGDYDVITLMPPFTVAKYRDAIRAFEEAGHNTIIVDSLSHAWAGQGGLLDKQGQLEASGKYRSSFATWREITPEQNQLIEQLLASPAHIIATMRTKTEYVVDKDEKGRSSVRKVGLSPVQRDGVEYEFTVVMDLAENHTARASKDRTSLLDGWCDRIGRDTGRMLQQWLDSGSEPQPQSIGAAAVADIEQQEHAAAAGQKPKAKQTVGAWLEQLETRLDLCADRTEVEGLILSNDVCRAASTLTGTARHRLRDITSRALGRHGS